MSLKSDEPLEIRSDPAEARSLHELITAIRPDRGRWDMIACTDGSGSTNAKPGGYAAVLLDRRKPNIHLLSGSMSHCSSQNAEVRAIFELTNYLVQQKVGFRAAGYHVYVITDSKYVESVLTAIRKNPVAAVETKSHRLQWVGIQYAARVGIILHPIHVGRNSNPLMTLADAASKVARLSATPEDMVELVNATVAKCSQVFPLVTLDRRPNKPQY